MKLGILTWSKEVNHGAVLQAYATSQLVKEMGHDTMILDYVGNHHHNMDNVLSKRIARAFSRVRPDKLIVRLRLAQWNEQKRHKFEKFRNEYLEVGKLYSDEPGLDKVLIGSDMVFDFYEGYNPFMYGKGINCSYSFSYAASFGYTTKAMLENYCYKDEIVNLIKQLKGVSFRDNNTGDVLREVCGIAEATKSIDPVMLYSFLQERKNWNHNQWKDRKYLLIYSYTYNMDTLNETRAIKAYAREHGLEIISVGYLHLWCDYSINADPKEFVEMVENATFVVTDTFHGTIFSLTFEKQFAVVVRNNAFKIVDIMTDLGLNSYLEGSLEEKLHAISDNPIDYGIVNAKMQKLREHSMRYLLEQVNA